MKRNELAYMASALTMMSQGLEISAYHREKPKPRKCDQKKCKYFHKTKHNCHCSYSDFIHPMNVACSHYEKRKK